MTREPRAGTYPHVQRCLSCSLCPLGERILTDGWSKQLQPLLCRGQRPEGTSSEPNEDSSPPNPLTNVLPVLLADAQVANALTPPMINWDLL